MMQGHQKPAWLQKVMDPKFCYRVIVTGGRHYTDFDRVLFKLEALMVMYPRLHVIHGNAQGADSLAHSVCMEYGIPVTPYPADWDKYGNAAGPIRNEVMLRDGKPHGILPFPGGTGTKHMISIAYEAGVHFPLS